MIPYLTISALVNALSSITLALLIYTKSPTRRLSRSFSLFCLFVALWSIPYFFWQLADSEEQAVVLCRLLMAGAALIPVSLHYFVSELTHSDHRRLVRSGYLIGAFFSIASVGTPYVVTSVGEKMLFPLWPEPGLLFYPFMVNFSFYSVISFITLIRYYRAADTRRRKEIQFVVYGLILCYFGGLTNFLLWFDIPIPPVGNGLVAVYVAGVGYSIMKFRLMEVDLILLKGACYVSFIFIVSLVLTVAITFFGYSGGGVVRHEFQVVSTFLISSLVLTGLFWLLPAYKRFIERFVEGNLLRDRFAYRRKLKDFVRRIGELPNQKNIFNEIVIFIAREMDIPKIALFFRGQLEGAFTCRAYAGYNDKEIGQVSFKTDSPLPELLRRKSTFLAADEIREELHTGREQGTSGFAANGISLSAVIPITHHDDVIGFLCLGDAGGKATYSDVDLSLLESLCMQVALVFFARELESKANQADRLISLGTFAASMAHEIRNPLVSIQTFVSLLGEQEEHPQLRKKLHAIMERDVNRIASIVENIGCLSENGTRDFSEVDLGKVIDTSIEISRKDLEAHGICLKVWKSPEIIINGNFNQLIQVFINLIQNAMDALESVSNPILEIRCADRYLGQGSRAFAVELRDNGEGIDSAMLSKIFDPFISTKDTGDVKRKRGMGLGLSIVKRIIDHHHGEISVESEKGQGTLFRVTLPAGTTTMSSNLLDL